MTRREAYTADLFAVPHPAAPLPASMDFRAQISHTVAEMLKDAAAAGINRYQVSARASELAGRDISKAMLDGYTAESREEFNLPFWSAPVLETVCSSMRLTEWLARVRGGRIVFGAATIDAEIGRIEHERDQATERLRQLRELRRGVK
jgi:hypothetical protein